MQKTICANEARIRLMTHVKQILFTDQSKKTILCMLFWHPIFKENFHASSAILHAENYLVIIHISHGKSAVKKRKYVHQRNRHSKPSIPAVNFEILGAELLKILPNSVATIQWDLLYSLLVSLLYHIVSLCFCLCASVSTW